MKKLIAGAVALTISGSAMAAGSSVGFAFGTDFYTPAAATYSTQNGQNFTISWALDNDISLGVYSEAGVTLKGVTAGTIAVAAIQVSKGVMKNVSVGLNLGSATTTVNDAGTGALADVFGAVNILSGSGDKVSGSLQATVSARFLRTVADLRGTNLGLAVGITF